MIPKGTFAGAFLAGILSLGMVGFAEDAAQTVLVKALETDGNTQVSNLAIQAIFERTLEVWPIPQDGIRVSPERLENLLVAIGQYYHQRGKGGTFIYVPKSALEAAQPPKLKGDTLVISFVESKRGELPVPGPAWIFARAQLTPGQEALASVNAAREGAARRAAAEKAVADEARKAREESIKRARAEAEAKLRAQIEARRRAVQAAMDKRKAEVEARAKRDGGPFYKVERFESRGNAQVSARAVEAVFERSVGLWPLPAEGIELSKKQIQTLLEDIGEFYKQRERGGPFIYVANADVVNDRAFKWNTLRVRIIESKRGEVVKPIAAWLGVSGPLDEKQTEAKVTDDARRLAEAERKRLEEEAKARAAVEAEAARKAEEARKAAAAAARAAAIAKFNQQEAARNEPLIKVTSFAVEGNEQIGAPAFTAILERNLGFWPLPEGGISVTRSTLKKYLEDVGGFYSMRNLGGTFLFIEKEIADGALKVNVEESREGKQAIASPAWLFIRSPLSDKQAIAAARVKAVEEAEAMRKARAVEAEKERKARQEAIERSRREAAAITLAKSQARSRAQSEAIAKLQAQVAERAKAEEGKGGVLIKVGSFSAEGYALITFRALETMFIRHILGLEKPTLLSANDLIPPEGLNISPDVLRKFLEEVLKFYTNLGHQGVYVYVPQDSFEPSNEPLRLKLKDDDLHIKVVEGRIKRVTTDYEVTKRPRPWAKVLWRKKKPKEEKSAVESEEGEAREKKGSFIERWRSRFFEKNAPFKPGDPIRKDKLERYVDFLERRSGSVAAVIQKTEDGPVSEVGGDVEVQLRVRAYDPLTFYIESSDIGSETTNKFRYRAGMLHSDVTGRGDVFSFDFSSALDFDLNNISIFASYDTPLGDPHWRVRMLGAYSRFESIDLLGPGTAFLGDGVVLGEEVSYNLYHIEDWFVDVYQGLDFQNSTVQTPFGLETQVNLFDVVFGGRITRTKGKWKPRFDTKIAYNISEFVGMSDDSDFARSRTGTETSYVYVNFSGGHTYQFSFASAEAPKAGDEDEDAPAEDRAVGLSPIAKRQRLRDRLPPGNWLSLSQNFRALYSPDRLPSAKQIFIGGASTVRGYEQSEASGDLGFYLTNELRLSVSEILAQRKAKRLGGAKLEVAKTWVDDLSFEIVPFSFDYGVVFNNEHSASERESLILLSTGFGTRMSFKSMFFASLYGGFALRDAGDDPADDTQAGDNAVHFDVTIRF